MNIFAQLVKHGQECRGKVAFLSQLRQSRDGAMSRNISCFPFVLTRYPLQLSADMLFSKAAPEHRHGSARNVPNYNGLCFEGATTSKKIKIHNKKPVKCSEQNTNANQKRDNGFGLKMTIRNSPCTPILLVLVFLLTMYALFVLFKLLIVRIIPHIFKVACDVVDVQYVYQKS